MAYIKSSGWYSDHFGGGKGIQAGDGIGRSQTSPLQRYHCPCGSTYSPHTAGVVAAGHGWAAAPRPTS
jgi:hypothetical protein